VERRVRRAADEQRQRRQAAQEDIAISRDAHGSHPGAQAAEGLTAILHGTLETAFTATFRNYLP
jgi:hypothetical protein